MTAFSLATFAQLQQTPLRKGIILNIIRHSPIMERLSFVNVDSLESIAVRLESLPDMAFRSLNEGYTAGGAQYGQVAEGVFGLGGELQFDRVYDKLKNTIKSPKQLEVEAKTMAAAIKFNDYFINGDHAVDAKGFEGLKKRIANLPSRQTIPCNPTSTTDILDPTASAANARKFLRQWEKAHYRAGNKMANVILMNESLAWAFADVLRYAGISGGNWVDMTKDLFDREVVTYKGTPFVDMGFKKDQSTEIITVTENPGDGGADATSAYFVPFNEEQGIQGIQLGPMEIYDPLDGGEKEAVPANMMRFEWWVGLAGFGSYGPTRLYGIEDPNSWT